MVVGGVGGSGTRVVEELMRRLHVYTGADLNAAGDNRWFTLLCKLPRWDLEVPAPESPVVRVLGVLEGAMTGRLEFSGQDKEVINDAARWCRHWWRHDRLIDDRPPAWVRDRIASLLRSDSDHPDRVLLWGWKEPNSHLFIRHLHAHFGDRLRYVHVIRNGLHMAQSRNQLQLTRWGSAFGLPDTSSAPAAASSLDYWIRANEAAVAEGRGLPDGGFLLVNYDDLCAAPEREITRFVDFLGLDPPDRVRRELASVPRPSGAGERVDSDVETLLGPDRLARVRALGFSVGES